jgi:hypothetical protein
VDRGRAAGQVRVPDQDRTEGGSYREHQVALTCFFYYLSSFGRISYFSKSF